MRSGCPTTFLWLVDSSLLSSFTMIALRDSCSIFTIPMPSITSTFYCYSATKMGLRIILCIPSFMVYLFSSVVIRCSCWMIYNINSSIFSSRILFISPNTIPLASISCAEGTLGRCPFSLIYFSSSSRLRKKVVHIMANVNEMPGCWLSSR